MQLRERNLLGVYVHAACPECEADRVGWYFAKSTYGRVFTCYVMPFISPVLSCANRHSYG